MPVIAVDIETDDPGLKDRGAGAIRREGEILGVGMYSPEMRANDYLDWDDPDVEAILTDPTMVKVFHNGVYDLDWLMHWANIDVKGPCEDTMTRAFLLDAYQQHYDLDTCAKRIGIEGKNKGETIEEWWKSHGGKGKAVEHLKDIPRDIVAKYCLQDCKATYELFNHQQLLLEQQDLIEANQREVEFYPVLMQVKQNGIRIDSSARVAASEYLNNELEAIMKRLQRQFGCNSLRAPSVLGPLWTMAGLSAPKTKTGMVSLAEGVLEGYCKDLENYTDEETWTHKLPYLLYYGRRLDTAITKFVDGAIVEYRTKGRLHPTFYPTKRDGAGTKTGRFSCQDPNLQQVSGREAKFGHMIRGIFVPEEDCYLGAFDYKQIEYITFIHFASGQGAEEARQKIRDGLTDYHQIVMDIMGWTTKDQRMDAKMINFGSVYGLGAGGLSERLHKPLEETKAILDKVFSNAPFIKRTTRDIQNTAIRRGYVRTLGGRRQRLDGISYGKGQEQDVREAYKLVNYLVQGSCSDILKEGQLKAWKAGVFDVLKVHGWIHDEALFSIPKTREGYQAAEYMAECMTNTFKLKVPIRVDKEIGLNWGQCDTDTWKCFAQETA